jgi:hypothetical protein
MLTAPNTSGSCPIHPPHNTTSAAPTVMNARIEATRMPTL